MDTVANCFQDTQQQVQRLAEDVRRRSTTPEKPSRNLIQEEEIESLRDQLNEFIEERERSGISADYLLYYIFAVVVPHAGFVTLELKTEC